MNDPNKKSLRSFQCRDVLWDTFGLLAADLECSVDYLINEAMKQYARQRSARSIVPDPARIDTPVPGPTAASGSAPGGHVAIAASSSQAAPGLPPPRPPPPLPWAAQGPAAAIGAPPPPPLDTRASVRPPLPAFPTAAGRPPPMTAPNGQAPFPHPYSAGQPHPPGSFGPPRTPQPPPYYPPAPPPPASVAHAAPPAYPAPPPAPPPAPGALPLAAIYGGARYAVTKDRFVIGRGKQAVDLTIKDPNISRQHAMVEHHAGQYFLVDLGSTNGLECNGERVVRRAITEGDVVRICDHEVRFTFRRG